MEDSFQFIIESPQHNTGHKKRPRLVTSCDNCRLKKIKCLQPSPETKCEACKAAKIQCKFRDRERYFAERSRAIAGPGTQNNGNNDGYDQRRSERTGSLDAFSVGSNSSSPAMSSSNARSNSHSPKAGGMVSPDVPSNGRYQSYSPDPRHAADPRSQTSMYAPRGSDPAGYAYTMPPPPQSYQATSRDSPPPLFDTRDPQYPDQHLMQHLCAVFFHHFARQYPFLVYEDVLQDLFDHVLPALIQNSIAAMAVRYSDNPSLISQGVGNVVETYSNKAKAILQSIAHIPDLQTLHGIMLLSWSEFRNSRVPSARSYFQMAWRMAYDLGLSEQTTHQQPHLSDKERSRRAATWVAIHQLNDQINAPAYNDHR